MPAESGAAPVSSPPGESPSADETTPRKHRKRKPHVVEPEQQAAVAAPPPVPHRTQSPDFGTAPDKQPKRVSYWAPLLVAYAAPPAGFAIARSSNSAGLAVAAVFVPPVIHWVNGQVGKGFLALFMAPLAAGVGAVVGLSACGNGRSCDTDVLTGAFVGYAGWVAIDVSVQAYKTPKVERAAFGVGALSVAGGRGGQVGGVF